MAKRLMVLLGMLALALTTAVPAFAQGASEYQYGDEGPGPRVVTATGVLGEPYTPGEDPTPVYDLTDEATGTTYRLFDVGAGLEPYVGQRVTVEGTRSPGIDPLSLDVTSVVPAGSGGPPPGPMPGSSATFTYELAVECEPPAGATFLGQVPAESLIPVELTDPDGDGVYSGSLTVPKFAPGGPPEPVSLPVRIVQGPPTVTGPLGPEYRVIEDFGTVTAEDRTFEASVSFCDGNGGTDDPGDGGPDGNGGGAPVVSGDGNDVKGGGTVPAVNGGTNGGGGATTPSGPATSGGKAQLPATGGLAVAGVIGAALIAGGLGARRIFR